MIGVEPQTPDLPLFDDDADRRRSAAARIRARVAAASAGRAPADAAACARAAPAARDAGHGGDARPALAAVRPPRARAARAAALDAARRVLAGSVRRVSAALLDVVLLGGVHAVTLYFTLRLCGLDAAGLARAPAAARCSRSSCRGRRVSRRVHDGWRPDDRQDGVRPQGGAATMTRACRSGTAARRALGAIASTLCLGAGLLPALLHEDRRALHDRLAGTRVVRLPA